jgi:tight adherence protein C
MPGPASIVVFGAVFFIVMALVYAFSEGSPLVTERLGRLWRVPGRQGAGLKGSRQKLTAMVLAGVAKVLPSAEKAAEPDLRLLQAGFRRPEARSAYRALRVAAVIVPVWIVYITGFWKINPLLVFLIAAMGGYVLPDIWLRRRIAARQHSLRLALPDALDLLVICMEAGLGIDQALMYVSQELRIAHRDICEEFDIVNAEMHVGKPRIEALRSLSIRTGVDDLQALVATLIQTDRFGTSVAQSLRVHSDDLRTKRRQRAEEKAAKTTVKMLFPLVFFIFPALFVVLLGPAVITMLHTLGKLH